MSALHLPNSFPTFPSLSLMGWETLEDKDALLVFSHPLPVFIEAVAHDGAHGDEVVDWAEAASWDVALDKVSCRGCVWRIMGCTLYWTGS